MWLVEILCRFRSGSDAFIKLPPGITVCKGESWKSFVPVQAAVDTKRNGPAKMPSLGLTSVDSDFLRLLVAGRLHDQVIDDAVRFVDVPDGAIAQTTHRRVIFFTGDIVVRFVQQFQRAMIAAGAFHVRIDRRVIVQILAVINGSPLDFVDGFVNLFDGVLFFFVHVMGGSQVLQVSARVPQVGKRMQVCRMPSRFVGKG
jgi:hypothetical protein